jgi:surface antigen
VKKIAVLAAGLPLVLGACAQNGGGGIGGMGQKQTIGALGGAAAGGLLGSQFGRGSGKLALTGAGVLLGGLLGSELGKGLDRNDQQYAARAYDQAASAPIGQQVSWNNPESGHSGTVTPTRDGRHSDGRYCREYNTTVYVGGRYQEARGQACQNPDGSWEVIS